MFGEPELNLQLEIAHLLLIDVVGYSKLLVNDQIELLRELNEIVRTTESFRVAETNGKLIRLPTGDGMALLFFRSPEEPAQCALEISRALQTRPHIQLRMGVHSGPVTQIRDVNNSVNVAGAGINVAQRVMDCGDARHILLSKHLADDLAQYRHWRPYLHDLGEFEVKHGLRLHLVNLCKDDLGNPALPHRLKPRKRWSKSSEDNVRPIVARGSPKFWLAAALLLSAIALAVSFSIFFRRSGPHIGTADTFPGSGIRVMKKSIAVLPFDNLSDDPQNAHFSEGVQDEILTHLAKVADLKVISRTSVMQYSGGERKTRDIAADLGVAYILEGSVQRAGGRVRVSAQLIDTRTDTHLWAEHYDRDVADVFAIESEVAEEIVAQLKSKLSPAEKADIERAPTSDLAAYDAYIRAKHTIATAAFNVREKEKLFEAASLLEEAIARDPAFFLAYCQLARTHDRLYILGIDHTATRLALADNAIKTAMRLRPGAGEAHLAAAAHFYSASLDYDRARQELVAAGRALPNEPLVFELTGYIDRRQGRWDDCVNNLKRALQLDPHNFFILQQLSLAYEALRRFVDGKTTLERAALLVPKDAGTRIERAAVDLQWRADPTPLRSAVQAVVAEDGNAAGGIAQTWLYLALCERDQDAAIRALAAMTGDGCRMEGIPFPRAWCEGVAARARGDAGAARAAFTTARVQIDKIVREQPNYAEPLCVLGLLDAGVGRCDDAIREGKRAVELLPANKDAINGALLIEYLAVIYAWCGEKDHALEQLAIAVKIPSDVNYGQLKLHPYWDPLRGDPRFEKIVASLAPK
jgi:TolB-like protein/class 3 adenylate cyclase/Tfp pilus assembly protein PilF